MWKMVLEMLDQWNRIEYGWMQRMLWSSLECDSDFEIHLNPPRDAGVCDLIFIRGKTSSQDIHGDPNYEFWGHNKRNVEWSLYPCVAQPAYKGKININQK